jgi:hypothetical protein
MGLAYVASRDSGPVLGPGFMQGALGTINRLLTIEKDGPSGNTASFWTLGSTNFTPDNLLDPAPIPNDRPYASLLYLGVGYQKVLTPRSAIETELQLGILGTNVGRWVQTKIHERCCPDKIPMGWDNQIGDGGSPTFLYHARWLRDLGDLEAENYRLVASVGGEAGYYVRGTGGLTFLFGWNGADVAAIRMAGASTSLRTNRVTSPMWLRQQPRQRSTGFGGWIDYELSYILHNELLQGSWTRSDAVTFSYDETEHVVHRASAGIDLAFLPKLLPWFRDQEFHLYLTQAWRTRDLKGAALKKHHWGGLTFSYSH